MNAGAASVCRADHEALNGHAGGVLYFTGLSGAGKSTIATLLEQRLHDTNIHTCLLDGDVLRSGLCSNLGFSDADRVENMRRVTEVARLMVDAGLVVITALIAPFRAERAAARARFAPGDFLEVFIDAVRIGEAEVAAQARAQHIAVEQARMDARAVQPLLEQRGDGRLARARQAGEVQHAAGVAVQRLVVRAAHRGRAGVHCGRSVRARMSAIRPHSSSNVFSFSSRPRTPASCASARSSAVM